MVKQTSRILLSITLCTSSLIFSMEAEKIEKVKVASLQKLALEATLKNPQLITTNIEQLTPECKLMLHEALQKKAPLLREIITSKISPIKHISLENFKEYVLGPFGYYMSNLKEGEFTNPEDEQNYRIVLFAGQKWHTYPVGQIYVHDGTEFVSKEEFATFISTYHLPHSPEKSQLIIKNPNETKLMLFEESLDKGAHVFLYNLKSAAQTRDTITEKYKNLSFSQLCLLSTIQKEHAQGKPLEFTDTQNKLFNDLAPEMQSALAHYVIRYIPTSLFQKLWVSCKKQLFNS